MRNQAHQASSLRKALSGKGMPIAGYSPTEHLLQQNGSAWLRALHNAQKAAV